MKSISFVPKEEGVYPQMPYEEISKEEFNARMAKIKKGQFSGKEATDASPEQYCDACNI